MIVIGGVLASVAFGVFAGMFFKRRLQVAVQGRTWGLNVALCKSEARYRGLFDNALDAVLIADDEARHVDANPAACALLGYSREELLRMHVWDVLPDIARESRQRVWQDFLRAGQQSGGYVLSRKDGALIQTDYRAVANFVPGLHLAVLRDVTAHQRAVEALQESEEKYRTLYEHMAQGAFYQRADGLLVDVNSAALQMFGLSRDQFLGRTSHTPQWQVRDEDGMLLPAEKHPSMVALRTGAPVRNGVIGVYNPHKADDVWMNVNAIPQFRPGEHKPYQVFVTLHDVTELKRAQDALRTSRKELRLTLDATTDGIWTWEFETNGMFFSPRYYTMLGYAPGAFPASFEGWRALIHPDDVEGALAVAERWLQSKSGEYRNEFRLRARDGTYRWMYARGSVVEWDENGAAVRMIGNHEDITQRKRIEEALKESEARYKALFDSSPSAILVLQEGQYVLANPSGARMLGFSDPKDVVGLDALELMAPESRELMIARMQKLKTGKSNPPIEMKIIRRDGTLVVTESTSVSIELGGERATLVIGRDVTGRKRAEAALRESESRLRQAQQLAQLGYWDWYIDTKELRWSEETYRIFGQDPSSFQPTVQALESLIHPADLYRFIDERERALAESDDASIEHRIVRPDGAVRSVHELVRVLRDAQGNITYVTGTVQDVTERKQTERQLRTALDEKETLLRELYHRTKNNMQVICAMLDFQASYVADTRLSAAFKETQNRIQSMALVHQKLYQSQNLSRINLSEYVSDLARLLMDSYEVVPDRVKLVLDTDDVFVLIDTAIPCGLILNELISNALKHAFPGDRVGEVKVRLYRAANADIVLRVSDNGVGVPEDFDFRHQHTLGLDTVLGLGEAQLRGDVAFEAGDGVSCQLRFRDDLYQARV